MVARVLVLPRMLRFCNRQRLFGVDQDVGHDLLEWRKPEPSQVERVMGLQAAAHAAQLAYKLLCRRGSVLTLVEDGTVCLSDMKDSSDYVMFSLLTSLRGIRHACDTKKFVFPRKANPR